MTRHVEAERVHDPSQLAVLAFLQADGEPGIAPLRAVEHGPDRAINDAADRDALRERLKPRRVDDAVDA
jgi:hypothetical protein